MEERLLEIYVSKDHNPYRNLAVEEYLCGVCADHSIILYLWQNESTVVIGRNQNAYEQCNMDFIKGHGIKIARRLSGGGAVYHDLGNLNYSVIGSRKIFSKEKYMQMVIDSIRAFGIQAEASGRNDIEAGGRKISGTAYFSSGGALCQHGCIMVNTDQDIMYRALRIKKDKFISKYISSVHARTANLRDFCRDIDTEKLSRQCIRSFCSKYPGHVHADISRIYADAYYKELVKKYFSEKWNVKENAGSRINVYGRMGFGDCSIVFDVEEGIIKKTRLYTDSLLVEPVRQAEEVLSGIPYGKDSILNALERHRADIGICSDLIELVQEKMED